MKKTILFSVLGGIILFAWQFLSYAMPNFHKAANTYTPLQGEIIQKLEELGLQEGMYLLGQADPIASKADQEKMYEALAGKPWASLNYQKSMDMDMVMPMTRGIIVCIVISFFLLWLFRQQKEPTLQNRMLLSLAVGMIGFFFVPYSNFIWYKEPDIFAYFADGIVPWAVLGFLGHKMA